MELDDFRAAERGGKLKLDGVLQQITDTDPNFADIVRQALAGPKTEFPDYTIARVLTRNGWPISETAIRNWRAKHHG